jgi:hypothetical protein
MKKLFTFVTTLLLTLCAVGVNAQTTCTLGGQSKNGNWSYGWEQEFGASIDLLFTADWGEFNLATDLTGAVSYKLTVAEANGNVNLRFYGEDSNSDTSIAISGTEMTGSLSDLAYTPSKIGVQSTKAGEHLSIVSFVLIDAEGNETQTVYSTQWGTAMLGGKYTSTNEWAEMMVNGVETLEKQRLDIKFNADTPSKTNEDGSTSGALHLKIIKADDTEEYPVIPAGVMSYFYYIDAPVKQVSIQPEKMTGINVDIASVTTQPFSDVSLSLKPCDIYTALQEATASAPLVRNVVLELEPGDFTISNSITINGSLLFKGINATIDASELQGPMVTTGSEQPASWTNGAIAFIDLKIKGLKKPLFASATKNCFYEGFSVSNCVIEVAADVTTFDFTKGSVAKQFAIENSTFYAPTATTKSFYSSQGGQKATEVASDMTQSFIFSQSTFYNLTSGKNFFTHRQNSQKWLIYEAKNNIFVNCGKSGQTILGMNGGGKSANPVWKISGNVFNFNGEDTSAQESTSDEEEPIENSIAGVITFTDVNAPDFGGDFATNDAEAVVGGDPRWTINVVASSALDTSNLRALISQAEELVRLAGDNPDASAQALATAIGTANSAIDAATTQDEIDQAASALQQAIDNYNTATGIQAVATAAETDSWYTLQGVSVAQPAKGLYIKNGKKVLVK